MGERPTDGYEVRSRISGRSDGRSRALIAVAALAVVGWLAATLTSQPPATADNSPPPAASPRPAALPPFLTSPPGTLPPALEILAGDAPTDPFAVEMGGLTWLDPTRPAAISGPDSGWAQWPFVFADGSSICVCLRPGDGVDLAPTIFTSRWTSAGARLGPDVATELPHLQVDSVIDVTIAPDAGSVFIVSATPLGPSWEIRVDWIAIDSSVVDSRIVGSIANADVPNAGIQVVRVWVAPDGRHLRIEAGEGPRGFEGVAGVGHTERWLLPIRRNGLRAPVALANPDGTDANAFCSLEAWATPDDFIRFCLEEGSNGQQDLAIRRESLDAEAGRVVLESSTGPPYHWDVDQTSGIAYGWDIVHARLVRVEVPSLALVSREVRLAPPGSELPPEAGRPTERPERARWSRSSSGWPGIGGWLAGSPDGSLLYAMGPLGLPDGSTPGPGDPTGVLVFDAETLDLVDHWAPAAAYQWIGLTPDGRYLLAVGAALRSEQTTQTTGGLNLVIHRASDGEVVEIIRRVGFQIGGIPSFLVPGPIVPTSVITD